MMQELDPFSYYPGHRSAIEDLGGDEPSPDPNYCFHTNYIAIRPGLAQYDLQLQQVRATRGELALRIHASGWGAADTVSLVTGAQLDVASTGPRDLAVSLRFYALPGVKYALYGYSTKDTDITADGLQVFLAEDVSQDTPPEAPQSVMTLSQARQGAHSNNVLIHVVSHHLAAPVSQDCTIAQLAEIKSDQRSTNALDDWAEAMCLNALRINGVTVWALEGLLIGHGSDHLRLMLGEQGFSMRGYAPEAPPPPTVFADFLVWPEGLPSDGDSAHRWGLIDAWFTRLKIGGIGVVTCRFRPNDPRLAPAHAEGDHHITQNEIGRWALLLIDKGFSVAPLAFSATEDLALDDAGLARFALIARRVSQPQRI